MLTLLLSLKKFGTRPADMMGISDSYTAWCFDEAVLYLLAKIEEAGEIPDVWQEQKDNKTAVASMLQQKGVIFNDRRRNDRRKSDS